MQEAHPSVDPLLHPFLKAMDEAASQELLTELIRTQADPVIHRILRSKLQVSFYGAGNSANHEEAEDVYGEVMAQLLTDLQACKKNPTEKPINYFAGFVARLTLNACYKHLRGKYPQRHTLKNKLRYLLTRQPGFAIWEKPNYGLLCGYAMWQGQTRFTSPQLQKLCDDPTGFAHRELPHQAKQNINPAECVAAIFNYIGHPFELDVLVNVVAELWGVRDKYESLDERSDNGTMRITELADQRADVASEVSNRLYLQRLWEEICALPVKQRTALLLNLRDENGNSVVPLLPAVGIASIGRIAETLELKAQEFARIWYDLPLEDSRIGELLGLTRQQIINLRKSARERLARRMKAL